MAFHRDYPFAVNSSPKAVKAQAFGYLNAIHYLAPAHTSGINLCPKASAGCKALCLGWHSGQSGMVSHDAQINSTRQSRLDKTRRFMRDRKAYLADIVRQIERQQRIAARRGMKLCVRLNGSSDIAWEGIRVNIVRSGVVRPTMGWEGSRCDSTDGKGSVCSDAVNGKTLFDLFPEVNFVDYTKIVSRFNRKLPANYHLTLSRSETNEGECLA